MYRGDVNGGVEPYQDMSCHSAWAYKHPVTVAPVLGKERLEEELEDNTSISRKS